jgi:hypothetical protein
MKKTYEELELAPKIAAKEAEVRNQPHLRPD